MFGEFILCRLLLFAEEAVFQNQFRSFNGYSFAINDYTENDIVAYVGTPEMTALQNNIDPYHYRTRLTMPKFVITGLMDEFQMTDDERHWFDEMPSGPTGEGVSDGNTKWLLKNPNTEHSTAAGRLIIILTIIYILLINYVKVFWFGFP